MKREINIASELIGKKLSHVIPILDAGLDEGSGLYYVVMSLAETCLAERIRASGPVSDSEAIQILSDITHGLLDLPQIVHRDLKPANVLWHDGKWKLADFGISKLVEDASTQNTMQAFWSAPYAAPEQWREEIATYATDIYALGAVSSVGDRDTESIHPSRSLRSSHDFLIRSTISR